MMAMDGCCGYACLGRSVGTLTALFLFIGGILTLISTSPACWAVGIYMICVSLLAGVLETPLLCQFVECFKPLVEKTDKVTPGYRAIFYVCMCIFNFFCLGLWSLLTAALLIATGFLYGMEWLGPRGGRGQQPQRVPTSEEEADEEALIDSQPTQDDAEAGGSAESAGNPWDKFVDSVGQAAGKAIAKGAVDSFKNSSKMTGSVEGSSTA